jgi:hypothetical protein
MSSNLENYDKQGPWIPGLQPKNHAKNALQGPLQALFL